MFVMAMSVGIWGVRQLYRAGYQFPARGGTVGLVQV